MNDEDPGAAIRWAKANQPDQYWKDDAVRSRRLAEQYRSLGHEALAEQFEKCAAESEARAAATRSE